MKKNKRTKLGLINGVNPTLYSNPNFLDDEMEQIRIGLEKGLDVSLYAKEDFDSLDMYLVRSGLKYGFKFKKDLNSINQELKSDLIKFLNNKYKEFKI